MYVVRQRNGYGISACAPTLHLDLEPIGIQARARRERGIANRGVGFLDRRLARAGADRLSEQQPVAREDTDLDEREQHQQQDR